MSLVPIEVDNFGQQKELSPGIIDDLALFYIEGIKASLQGVTSFQRACAEFYGGVLDNSSIIYPPEQRDIRFVHLGSVFAFEYIFGYTYHQLDMTVQVLGGKILSHEELKIRLRSRRFEEPPPMDILRKGYGVAVDEELETVDRSPLIEVEASSKEYEERPKHLFYRNSGEAVNLLKGVWMFLATNASVDS